MGLTDRIVESFSGVAAEVVRPLAEQTDKAGQWPEQAFDAFKAKGLMGLMAPADCGGWGSGALGLALASETLGRECASTAICFGMHCVGTAVLSANPSPDQRTRYLVPIAEGRHITTLSLSEPGSGAFFFFPQTRLQLSGKHIQIDGKKHFVTNGGHADSYVISGQTFDEAGAELDFSCAVVDRDLPGLDWEGRWEGVGMRGNSSVGMQLQGVEVPRGHMLGRSGSQIWYVFQVITPYFLIAMAGTYLGLARRALDEAIQHVGRRNYSHSGSTLADAPVVQHRIGSLWADWHRSRCAVMSAATAFDANAEDSLPGILAAKADVAECAVGMVNEAMTLCGGIGYREGGTLERLLRDVRAAHVMAPTTDLLRIWSGRALLGIPLLAE